MIYFQVKEAYYNRTLCLSDHLTSFGAGFFVLPNTVNFTYIFTHASFSDNVTIYLTVIFCIIAYICMMIWAGFQVLNLLTNDFL